MKKIKIIKITSILSIILLLCILFIGCGNQQWFDTTYTFNYAWVTLGDNTIVHGIVQSWKDFDNSDMIQVKINGETYLSHSSNIVLRAN